MKGHNLQSDCEVSTRKNYVKFQKEIICNKMEYTNILIYK